MATLLRPYGKTHTGNLTTSIGARFGGSRGRPHTSPMANEFYGKERGSHMPLDTGIHWDWSNPLNILPALVLLVIIIDVIGMILA